MQTPLRERFACFVSLPLLYLNSHSFRCDRKFSLLSFLEVATVATLEKIPLNLDNLCLAYPHLLYFAKLVAFQEAVANEVAALVLSHALLATDKTHSL